MTAPVILGAGLAGLSTALALAPQKAVVISPCALGDGCSSVWAQGGIAAAVGAYDSPDFHAQDTLMAGSGLNDPQIVQQTTHDADAVIRRLIQQGVVFDRDSEGNLVFGLEAAHGKNRIVHAKDATGAVVMQALIKAVRATPSITVVENTHATRLLVEDNHIVGVVLKTANGQETVHKTPSVILATGGATALWRDTTNPHENWGSGLVLAVRAGAALGDLEFTQFHPTAIDIGRDPMPLASEALRGAGATLCNDRGERFVDELLPRDVVTRAIWNQLTLGNKVFLDARQAIGPSFASRFPTIYDICTSGGIDPVTTLIPIRPAAHYHMGGVLTDAQGRTTVTGLWACGEVACTGLHGANRLASNSLLEAASFGWRVAKDILGMPDLLAQTPVYENHHDGALRENLSPEDKKTLRATMSDNVGVVRSREGLESAVDFLRNLTKQSDMALAGLMIALAALKRKESRGAHFRSDFPQTDPVGHRSRFHLSDLENL